MGTWKSQNELSITGKGPSARYDHGLQRFKNNLIVFGGRRQIREAPFAQSIYVLKLSNMQWSKLKRNTQDLSNCLCFQGSEFCQALVQNEQEKQGETGSDLKLLVFGGIDANF